MGFPVKKLWLAAASSAGVKDGKRGARTGLLKLRDEIQSCGYEDVQVMWDMMMRTTESKLMITTPLPHDNNNNNNNNNNNKPPKQRPFWRVFVWSSSNHKTSQSAAL
ncbi:unnamed protein product [Cuscuta campestris]|uniref:Uncharacterized protein n=2 Tax=Cuscuta sect. Cleistogrammica TaxID=1824901 RepID=A0A484LAL9_9ASTE|nr:hypothetical protein DM860_016785 [Cuscuta australis]VFQ73343.1 unnamed protein product [Cuscuta campestris]